MSNNIFTDDWEDSLLLQFLRPEPEKETAYICTPLRAEDADQYLINLYAARAYMFYAKEEMGYLARAPHAYLPMLLCDEDTDERNLALRFGLKLMEKSKLILVCGNKLSEGMKGEIVQAAALRKPIYVFDADLHHEVQKIVRQNRPLMFSAAYVKDHPVMAHPQPQMERAFRKRQNGGDFSFYNES